MNDYWKRKFRKEDADFVAAIITLIIILGAAGLWIYTIECIIAPILKGKP